MKNNDQRKTEDLAIKAMKFADARSFTIQTLANIVKEFYNNNVTITDDMAGMYWEDALCKAVAAR